MINNYFLLIINLSRDQLSNKIKTILGLHVTQVKIEVAYHSINEAKNRDVIEE